MLGDSVVDRFAFSAGANEVKWVCVSRGKWFQEIG